MRQHHRRSKNGGAEKSFGAIYLLIASLCIQAGKQEIGSRMYEPNSVFSLCSAEKILH